MISTRTHAVLDYITGPVLILAPYLFGFATGGIEQWLPQLLGVMIIGMSLLTKYELGAFPVIPLRLHLGIDMAGGALLAVSPWLFNFADIIWWPHLLFGLMEIVVPIITQKHPEERYIHAHHH